MKRILTVIGLTLHVIYYVFAVLSLGEYGYSGHGVGKAFAFWIYAMLTAIVVVVIYLIDGAITILKNRRRFFVIRQIVLALLVPLCLRVGCTAGAVYSAIWNSIFAAVFLMQITSLFVPMASEP